MILKRYKLILVFGNFFKIILEKLPHPTVNLKKWEMSLLLKFDFENQINTTSYVSLYAYYKNSKLSLLFGK